MRLKDIKRTLSLTNPRKITTDGEDGKDDADWPSVVRQLRKDIRHQAADTIVSSSDK